MGIIGGTLGYNLLRRISVDGETGYCDGSAYCGISKIETLLGKDEHQWKELIRGTAMERAKVKGLIRNLMIVAGNSGVKKFAGMLEKFVEHPEESIRTHARWAIEKLKMP